MQIFLDTANIEEIKKANVIGVLDGITTNPSLVAKANPGQMENALKEILREVKGSVSLEVVSEDYKSMMKEAKNLLKLGKNVVVKVPSTPDGIRACKDLSDKGARVNVTLCFSPNQALLAAKAGAWVVSPFIGRLDDIGHEGMELIKQVRQIYCNYRFKTKILTASVRHPLHVVQAAMAGSDIVTIPYSVFEKMFKHPLTDTGLKKFTVDVNKVPDYLKLIRK